MSRRQNKKYSLSRRTGSPLWGTPKDPSNKKNFPPGQHGPSAFSKRKTEYGIQLLAKQKIRMYYGDLREKQFRSIFKKAERYKGDTNGNLVALLESRLDSFVYRSKFSSTIFSARQIVSHKHIKVNNSIVNIPSYTLKPGDIIELSDRAKNMKIVLDSMSIKDRTVPDYIGVSSYTATYIRLPKLSEIPYPSVIEPHHVVEFYSR